MKPNPYPFLLAALLAITSFVHAEPGPPLIQYQGTLTNPDSTPVQGLKKLIFNLYDSPAATSAIWGPQVFDNVALLDGKYAVILGTTDSAGRSLADIAGVNEKYLGITVDGQELPAKLQILAAPPPPAVASELAKSVAEPARDVPDGVPPGTVVAYWSERIPDGWLLCDGSLVPEGPRYDRLRGVIGGNLPDLRGLFLRGIGQNSNPGFRYEGDAARGLWQFQQDEFKEHEHKFDDYTFSANAGYGGTAWGSAGASDLDNVPGSPFLHATARTGGEETRPKNAAVYWIIKY